MKCLLTEKSENVDFRSMSNSNVKCIFIKLSKTDRWLIPKLSKRTKEGTTYIDCIDLPSWKIWREKRFMIFLKNSNG